MKKSARLSLWMRCPIVDDEVVLDLEPEVVLMVLGV